MKKKRKELFIMAKKNNSELFSALLYIIIGVLLIVFPEEALSWAMTIAGVFFVVCGALDLLKQNWTGGAVSLIIGISILVLGWVLTAIVLLVFGILIAIKGIVALINILQRKKKNALDLVFPILTVVVGLLLAFGYGLSYMIIIVGILMAVDGVIGLVSSLQK